MNKFKTLFFLFATLASWRVFAFTPKELQAIKLIKADLAVFTKTLSRPIKIYHWNNLADVSETLGTRMSASRITLQSPEILIFAKKWQEGFWLNQQTNGEVGWGLYGASTPTSSMAWRCSDWMNESSGCSEWILLEISLPAGAKFLDLRSEGLRPDDQKTIKLSDETTKYLGGHLNCLGIQNGTTITKNGITYHMNTKSIISANECYPLIAAAMKESKLSFLAYHWFNEVAPGCDLPDSKLGFVVMNETISASNTKIFTSKKVIPAAEDLEYARLKSMLSEMHGNSVADDMVVKSTKSFPSPNYFYCHKATAKPEDSPLN